MKLVAFLLSTVPALVVGHGSLVSPRSRNSVDYLVNVNEQPCANATGDECHNGQASFWYSQGCFIGCPFCDHLSGRRQVDLCGLGMKATINDPKYRSVNRNATAGSSFDIYAHNPWRAPGSAPIGDACGFAGGTPWPPAVSEEGVYKTTRFAHHGMRGSELGPLPGHVPPTWKLGSEVEVSWQIRNNHGGGYQYRLCEASAVSEACFQSHPLEFVRSKQALVFANGTRLPIPGTFVDRGTLPAGSTWAMLPIPPTWLGPRCLGQGCEAWEDHLVDGPCVPCPGTANSDCSRCDNGPTPSFEPFCESCVGCYCDGCSPYEPVAVLDVVKIPDDLPPGEYVLGWRYDCEATAQVWSNCADVTISV